MDRIEFSQHALQPQRTASTPQPRLIDPSTRLSAADRRDTLELSSVPNAVQTKPVSPLIAAKVEAPAQPEAFAQPADAMRFYTNPSDQNAAATLGAGSKLDVLA